ncbi:MAG TPA: hypothetical protein PKL73_21810 [Polyangiaceae bacterium]|jgi:hypothetical protein|nr:hypothetical protein [Polyangiaceae bacterium]HNZ24946.1 hypothetical protein [Polyangiaceae bacterium]HOH03011.1 hypothetical protein [Polyangiaceae bacterium]HOR37274.1 hypothetical protein [Polyangiaceae bacterium]HOT12452.1 hypothetical protein [Polyangiaceae bacterium]
MTAERATHWLQARETSSSRRRHDLQVLRDLVVRWWRDGSDDCANTESSLVPVTRGGVFSQESHALRAARRAYPFAIGTPRLYETGFRCARDP